MPGEYKENFREELRKRKKDVQIKYSNKMKSAYGEFDDALANLDKNYNYVKEMSRISDISFIFNNVAYDKSILNQVPSVGSK